VADSSCINFTNAHNETLSVAAMASAIEIVAPGINDWGQPKSQRRLLKLQAITVTHSISRSSPTDVFQNSINIYDAHRS
jgi:hypothetical protein